MNDANNSGSPSTKPHPPTLPKVTIEDCKKEDRPLHYACEKGASLEVIKYIVEEAYDDDKGKVMLAEKDGNGQYPIHLACLGGASVDVIKYLVEEAYDDDKGKVLVAEKDDMGRYPIHWACGGGASLDVIKYLVQEAYDDEKGKVLLAEKDNIGQYTIHWACRGDASVDVIKYLVEEAYDDDKGKVLVAEKDEIGQYPIYLACYGGASLDVIKHLVEEAYDDDKGKVLLAEKDNDGRYPIHLACRGGASVDVIKYLVEEAYDDDKGKVLVAEKDDRGRYPIYWGCYGGASVDVIKYLVKEAYDDEKGKVMLGGKDNDGRYPIHLACYGGASLDVIKYLIQYNPLLLETKDIYGNTPLDLGDNDTVRSLFPSHQSGSVADKSSDIDRLNYSLYAQALAFAARRAEQAETSLCVGLYGRWGSGKSTLWKQIKKSLRSEFLQEDVQLLYNAWHCLGVDVNDQAPNDQAIQRDYDAAKERAEEPFKKALRRLCSDPYISQKTKEMWKNLLKSELAPPPISWMEELVYFSLRIFSCCKCLKSDDPFERVSNHPHIQRIYDTSRYARIRHRERVALVLVVISLILSPFWLILKMITLAWSKVYNIVKNYNMTAVEESMEELAHEIGDLRLGDGDSTQGGAAPESMKEQAHQIAGLISGDVPLGDGDSTQWGAAPAGALVVVISLQVVRTIARGFALVWKGLEHVVFFRWCSTKPDYTPVGAVEYKIVEFNAWTYQGSDLLWASLMKELWDAVEAQFGKKVVRYHRAGIALAGESRFDESYRALSPTQKALIRKRALLMFRAMSYFFLFLFLVAVIVTLVLTIPTIVDISNKMKEDYDARVIAALIISVGSFCSLLAHVIIFLKKVLPYIRKSRGEYIFDKVAAVSKRKDFAKELGFMGEVKREVEYLLDLLTTETYLDKDVGCHRSLRLCVFIDDLDRCPSETVVSVLEAVILLLVDGPISVWMAIDSRIVVQCIEKEKEGVFDEANINGHEFLDKIIQMPFALPSLTNYAKKGYLTKIIDEKELDPLKVVARFDREVLRKKLSNPRTDTSLPRNDNHYSQLVDISRAMEEQGNLKVGPEQEAMMGISFSELVSVFRNNPKPEHVSAEHKESLCSIVSESTSHFLDLESGHPRESRLGLGFVPGSTPMQPDASREKNTSNHTSDPTNSDTNIGLPPPGVYIPMLNENDRKCLVSFVPYIDGNPRRMKRIINVFNVSRHIAEVRCGKSSPTLLNLGPKILKLTILIEQWPYRMAWLLQIIEDVEHICTHNINDSSLVRFLQERFKEFDGKAHTKSLYWDILCNIDIQYLYQNGIRHLMSNADPSNMQSIDSDPELFEGLLVHNSPSGKSAESDRTYAISVKDLRSIGQQVRGQEYGECLRGYMFNMPLAIVDTVSKLMKKTLDVKENKTSPILQQLSGILIEALKPSINESPLRKRTNLGTRKSQNV